MQNMEYEITYKWASMLGDDNFLRLYDVVIDITDDMEMSPVPTIPLYQSMVKFKMLLPMDSIGWRDRYCEGRGKAVELLKTRGVVKSVEVLQGNHRWENRLRIAVDPPAITALRKEMDQEYQNRLKDPMKQASQTPIKQQDPIEHDIEKIRVTIPWLIKNVNWSVWAGFIGLLIAAFAAGVTAGQTTFVKELFGK
jgi:hypothetical protein